MSEERRPYSLCIVLDLPSFSDPQQAWGWFLDSHTFRRVIDQAKTITVSPTAHVFRIICDKDGHQLPDPDVYVVRSNRKP